MNKGMIRVEVECRLPGQPVSRQVMTVGQGITVRELLTLLEVEGLAAEVIIVYNGSSVTLADSLDRAGKVVLLPVICGG